MRTRHGRAIRRTVERLVVSIALMAQSDACTHSESRQANILEESGRPYVARVGSATVSPETVAGIARAQGISPRAALKIAIDSAVAAEAGRAKGFLEDPAVRWATRAALADAMLRRIDKSARDEGPPRDDEVAALTARHWRDVDVGEAVRVIHAVALKPKKGGAEANAKARQAMEHLADSLAHAKDAAEFETLAKAVNDPAFEMKVERLPAFQQDGRTIEGGDSSMVAPFVQAAFALKQPNQTSPVVETTFGYHVIRLLERLPGRTVPLEERRVAFAEETYRERGAGKLTSSLRGLAGTMKPELASGADELVAKLIERQPEAQR